MDNPALAFGIVVLVALNTLMQLMGMFINISMNKKARLQSLVMLEHLRRKL